MNETNETNNQDGRARVLDSVGRAGMLAASVALPILAIVGAALAMFVLFTSIQHLGTGPLAVNTGAATLVAASVTVTLGVLLVTDAALALTGKRRTLLIAGLFTLAWLTLAVMMAILDTVMSVQQIAIDKTLLQLGTLAYSALPALPVIPLVALAASAAHERHDQYPTLAAASGSVLLSVLKVLLTVAMFAFEAFFGMSLGISPIAAVFAATLNATAFALALGNVDAARHDGDRSGVNTWGAISFGYALLMFVIAIEAIVKLSTGAGAVGTLAAMHAPAWLETLAVWAFVSSIGLSAILLAATFWRKARVGMAADETGPTLAEGIRVVRRNVGDIADALRGQSRPALPSGTTARDVMGLTDEELRLLVARAQAEDAVRAAGRKTSENGTPYDTTGELVLTPEQDAELRASGEHNNTAGHNSASSDARPAPSRGRRTAAEKAGGGAPPASKRGGE